MLASGQYTIPLQNYDQWAIPMVTTVKIDENKELDGFSAKMVAVSNSCFSILTVPPNVLNLINATSYIEHNLYSDHLIPEY